MNRDKLIKVLVLLLMVSFTACTRAGIDPDSIIVDGSKHATADQIWEKESFQNLTENDLELMRNEGITGSIGITQTAVYAIDLIEHKVDLKCPLFFIIQNNHIIGMFQGEQLDYYPDGFEIAVEQELKKNPDTEYIWE